MNKAIILFCMTMSLFATSTFAQLKEVRGVQTRSVKYYEYDTGGQIEKWGYEFTNENDYDVWLEIKLVTSGFEYCDTWMREKVDEGVKDTKNITLKAGEKYLWMCGDRMRFGCGNYVFNFQEYFYVEYKAYKAD